MNADQKRLYPKSGTEKTAGRSCWNIYVSDTAIWLTSQRTTSVLEICEVEVAENYQCCSLRKKCQKRYTDAMSCVILFLE